jgi:hypothetical protein
MKTEAKRTHGYLSAVSGEPDEARGLFVLKLTYRDRKDKQRKAITLDVEGELADLASVCESGMEWYADQTELTGESH